MTNEPFLSSLTMRVLRRPSATRIDPSGRTRAPAIARAGISLSQLLFDGGRVDQLAGWRQLLAESAKFGQLSQAVPQPMPIVSIGVVAVM